MAENRARFIAWFSELSEPTKSTAKGAARMSEDTEPIEKPTSGLEAVVGIGASAGGLAALKRLFDKIPDDTGAAFVVAMHLSPDHENHLTDLLQQHSKLPFEQIAQTARIKPSRIYVIPPSAINELRRVEDSSRESDERLRHRNEDLERRVAERTAELRECERRLQALTIELSQAEAQERTRLAHVLHDDAQQALVAAQMRLNLIERKALDDATKLDLDQSAALLEQCQQTLRTLAGDLSPPALQERGLAPALEWLAKRMSEKHRLQVKVVADPEADPGSEGLPTIAFQVVRELLLNVVKHAGADRAEIRLTRTDGDVRLEVSDDGCGFDPAAAEKRAGETFGLFHARERLRHIGGELEIASAEGKGARVTIRIPVASEPVSPAGSGALRARATTRPQRLDRATPIRVLLADDHQTVREGLARLLEREPRLQIVGEVGDGAQVIEAVRRFQPQVVVMDVNMPKMNGIEATRKLKAEFPDVRVIGLSLHEASDMAEAMLEAGAENYFSKGGPSADLVAAILTPGE